MKRATITIAITAAATNAKLTCTGVMIPHGATLTGHGTGIIRKPKTGTPVF